MTGLYHVLDPAGDLVLILNPTSLVTDVKSLSNVHTNGTGKAGCFIPYTTSLTGPVNRSQVLQPQKPRPKPSKVKKSVYECLQNISP